MIRGFVEQAMQRGDRPLLVHNTAAQPWARRACELLGTSAIRLSTETAADPWAYVGNHPPVCRDRLAIELADRVDATFVRPKGTIMRLLCERLEHDVRPSVQILVTQADDQAAKQLMARGAIGYWINVHPPLSPTRGQGMDSPAFVSKAATDSLLRQPDQWLIHSTRARVGPWPGESVQQFNDWLLLRAPMHESPSPLQTLTRIVQERRLIGSHGTTSSDQTVVCFSALPLFERLARRTYRPHLGRWDAEPYGIAIRRDAAHRMDIQPVVYGHPDEFPRLEEDQRWRFQATGTTYDWTGEQEWRGRGPVDLTRFALDEVVVFVKHSDDSSALANCPWSVVPVAGQV